MDRLIIKLNTITENVTSELISKLYTNAKEIKDYEELNEIEDSLVELQGNLQTPNAYDDEVTYLETKFPNLHINVTVGRYIRFEDPEVLRVLLTTYGDGTGITISDILTISNIGTLFRGNTTITKFNEFRYFTGITNKTINWDTGDWFNGCTNLREITIPKNIENMTANNPAFYNCTSLETVIFDTDCVISVCPKFTGCTNLINISLPNSVTSISGGGFLGCSSLVLFDTNNVTDIQGSTFKFCSSLTSIILSNVIHIGSEAFNNCQALTTVTFNTQTLTLIDGISFEACSNLVINDLNLPNLTSLGYGAFHGTKIKQISSLGTITSIPNSVFQSCSQLTSVTLPNTVTTIGNYSFKGCSSLTSINDLSNITSVGYEAFRNCTSLKSVSFPNVVTLNSANIFLGSGLESISFPSLTSITDQYTFGDCTSLTSVSLPNLITSPGWNSRSGTFYGCTSLTQISLPLLTNICHSMFYHCTSLSSVSIPSCTSIGNYAFENCPITQLPCSQSNITRLGEGTFKNCSNLGLGLTLELNLTLLTSKLLGTFEGTKFKKLILHWPNALDDYFDGRYLIWSSMTQLEYIDMSDTITQGLASNHSQKTYSLWLNYAIETIILPSDINYLTTSIMSVDSNYTSYKYLILLSTTPPDILIDSNNPRNRFFARSTLLHIYVPDSVLQDYLSDTNWLQLGDGTSNFDLSTRVHGLSELPNGVWTTGLASLYLTSALLATS